MPEFSIVTCSIDENKFAVMSAYYERALIGESYEIVRVPDAKGLCEGYIRGFKQSKGDVVIFSHDDAAPMRPFASRLRRHLREVDVVGGAGTNRLIGPVWFSAGHPHIFGQVLNATLLENPETKERNPGYLLSLFGVPAPLVGGIQAIDGFWMAASRSVIRANGFWFDERTFDGFHLYDLDASYAAYRRGVRIGVATDLHLLHASTGGYNDPKFKPAAERFVEKWAGKLAVSNGPQAQFGGRVFPGRDEGLPVSVMEEMVELTR